MFVSRSPNAESLSGAVDALGDVSAGPDARAMVEQLEKLERLKSAAAAAQARITAELDDLRVDHSDASIGAEVGLARHESPHRGRRLLGLARALVDDLPETLAALARGDINEHRAAIIAEETRDLCRSDRMIVDNELAPVMAKLGDRELRDAAQRYVMRVDEKGALRRRARAQLRRHVTGRRLPDGMAQITGYVSDVHYAAIMSSLHERVATEIACGLAEGFTRPQLLADLFVERLTGQATASSVPVNLNLVVSAETMLGDDDEPAEIVGHGPIPASIARKLMVASPAQQTKIRRLFRLDDTDKLIAMESVSRTFDGLLANFVRIRDQICRTPWCNAPIKHLDHPVPAGSGGQTSEQNAQGLCEGCNYIKESSGWRHRVTSAPLERHTIEITSPNGIRTTSRSPSPPGGKRWRQIRPGVWSRVA